MSMQRNNKTEFRDLQEELQGLLYTVIKGKVLLSVCLAGAKLTTRNIKTFDNPYGRYIDHLQQLVLIIPDGCLGSSLLQPVLTLSCSVMGKN